MKLDQLAGHGETDAAAGDGLRITLEPVVGLPDSLALLGGYASAFVDHLDEQAIRGRARADRDRLPGGAVLHRVVEEIEQDLVERGTIDARHEPIGELGV
jgi:hypothetical protein